MQYINRRIQILLAVAFVIQMLTAWRTYFFHSDEYFQIIEFASYKLGLSPVKVLPWEFSQQIRPTIQPYIFIGLYKFFMAIGITNRFFMFSMVKSFVPRYRYDQLMRLGWKVFLPISLAMVVITAGFLKLTGIV